MKTFLSKKESYHIWVGGTKYYVAKRTESNGNTSVRISIAGQPDSSIDPRSNEFKTVKEAFENDR